MKDIFIVSKNTNLPNYLFLLLKEIAPERSFSLSVELSKSVDLIIIDTETIEPGEVSHLSVDAPVILFAYEIKPLLIQYTSKFDINAVISLTTEAGDLLKSIDTALERDIFYNDNMIAMLFSNKINSVSEKVGSLTERENEIIAMMMKDLTNEEIATDLNLSVRTVNAHKGNIMRKVGAKTTSGLMRIIMDYSPLFKNLP